MPAFRDALPVADLLAIMALEFGTRVDAACFAALKATFARRDLNLSVAASVAQEHGLIPSEPVLSEYSAVPNSQTLGNKHSGFAGWVINAGVRFHAFLLE